MFVSRFGEQHSHTGVLILPPLFEEMNLSRAVLAKVAQHIAASGTAVYMMDYAGTGDSEGEIDEVDSELWLQNTLDVGHWLSQQGVDQIILLGVRFGALLQLHFQQSLHNAFNIKAQIVWKPLTSGKNLSNQLLRLKHTNHVLAGGEKVDWRGRIQQGETIEVAGYPINERLLSSIEALALSPELAPLSALDWLELGTKMLSPALGKFQQGWPQVRFSPIAGQTFWQSPDIYAEPALYQIHKEIISRYE